MVKGWHNEFERHSLARQGIKTGRKSSASTKSYKMPTMMVEKPKKSNLLLSYCDFDVYESEKEQILEEAKENNEPVPTEDEINRRISNSDLSFYLDDFLGNLTEELKSRNPDGYWYVTGKKLDWLNHSGEKYIEAKTGQELLDQIAPKTSDYSVDVFRNGAGLSIKIYHHDVPMGSEYVLHKISEKKFNKETGVNY